MNLPTWFIEITLKNIQEKYKADANIKSSTIASLSCMVASYLGVKDSKPVDFLPFSPENKNKINTSVKTPDKETLQIFFRLYREDKIPSDVIGYISRYIPLWKLKEAE